MDKSDHKHLDGAALRWQLEQTRTKRWTLALRVLPFAIFGAMLAVVFRVFE